MQDKRGISKAPRIKVPVSYFPDEPDVVKREWTAQTVVSRSRDVGNVQSEHTGRKAWGTRVGAGLRLASAGSCRRRAAGSSATQWEQLTVGRRASCLGRILYVPQCSMLRNAGLLLIRAICSSPSCVVRLIYAAFTSAFRRSAYCCATHVRSSPSRRQPPLQLTQAFIRVQGALCSSNHGHSGPARSLRLL